MSKRTQTQITEYPQGTFLKTERGYFYVVSGTKRFRFMTKRVMDSWSPQRVVKASEQNLAVQKLRVTSKMKFRDGSLLYSQADAKMYLVSGHKLRHIVSPDVLEPLGLKRSAAVWVSDAEIKLHELGEPLS